MNFLNELVGYDVDTKPDKIFWKLRSTYIKMEKFNKESVATVSTAATTLLIWVIAIDSFQKVKKVVAPKEKKLKEAEDKLRVVEGILIILFI